MSWLSALLLIPNALLTGWNAGIAAQMERRGEYDNGKFWLASGISLVGTAAICAIGVIW